MNGRENRLKAIRKIIAESRVSSQDQLLHKLEDESVTITQATLSRDLKVLKVGKVPDAGGGYYYILSETEGESLRGYIEDFKRGYLSLTFSRNLGVIKTLAGHADTVAIALDRLDLPEILGTIAGDDTILVILKEGESYDSLTNRLQDLMGDLEAL
jgi:transcriptional regulator of arginine metabolism